jgi:hypothetical protein
MVKYIYHLTHNLKVAGSNPAPATNKTLLEPLGLFLGVFLFLLIPQSGLPRG